MSAREYFEKGCRCYLVGEVDKAPEGLTEEEVWDYYNSRCRCGRGYTTEGESNG